MAKVEVKIRIGYNKSTPDEKRKMLTTLEESNRTSLKDLVYTKQYEFFYNEKEDRFVFAAPAKLILGTCNYESNPMKLQIEEEFIKEMRGMAIHTTKSLI